MRATTAILLLAVVGSPGCANRGMHAPDGGPGAAGNTGTAGTGGGSGTGGGAGTGGSAPGGTGGAPIGTAGTGGGSCSVAATDGGASGGACGTPAMFNFDTDVQGATINAASSAFQSVAKSNAFTFCGSGALAITSMFSMTSGPTAKGEVLINLPGAPVDLTGKTITVHVASDPGCSQDLNLSLVLNTQAGAIYFNPDFPILRVTNTWKTGSTTVPAVNGSTAALALSLQAISSTGYQGTIYVDEIDIR